MSEAKMPATEVESGVDEQLFASYELAYHVLPTVADGEVGDVRDRIAAAITDHGGSIFDEEAPERFDLAYDIDKYLEGKHRKFSSAYFGWIRFRAERTQIESLTEVIDGDKSLLRHLLIKLTKTEEAMPFYFHQERAKEKVVTNVDAVPEDIDPNTDTTADTDNVDETEAVSTGTDTAEETVGADAESGSEDVSTTDKAA